MSQEKMEEPESATAEFKLNVHAPEFVPRTVPQAPLSGYYYPYLPFFGSAGYGVGPDWFYFGDHDQVNSRSGQSKNKDDVTQKIVKQVEYQFGDMNLVASDFLMKLMNKDPEGYVPMTVIASWKKIKSLGVNNQTISKALRTSSKLVVSDDGKKVRRKILFTERNKEDLQLRMVVVENLPEDHSRPNLEKIFNVAGIVKNIRICHPQENNPSASRNSKSNTLLSNKLHALVEYEFADQAENAVEKLNDEKDWRKGLRVRTMLRRSPRSVIRNKQSEFDTDTNSEDSSPSSPRVELRHNVEESPIKRSWGRGRAKPNALLRSQSDNVGKLAPSGPRMPDGTRGFALGRGRPLVVQTPTLPAIRLN